MGDADGSGVLGRLAYEISSGLTAGVNISYDKAFDTRISADIKVRFGGPNTTVAKKKKWENPTINALTVSQRNRDVRVHDCTVVRYGKRITGLTPGKFDTTAKAFLCAHSKTRTMGGWYKPGAATVFGGRAK